MKKFAKEFWWTLNNPEEWHPASIIAVGYTFLWLLAETFGRAIDLLY